MYDAAASVLFSDDAAEALQQMLSPSEKELKRRWRRLRYQRVRHLKLL